MALIGMCVGLGLLIFILSQVILSVIGFSNPLISGIITIVVLITVIGNILGFGDRKSEYSKLGLNGVYSFSVQTENKHRLWLEIYENGTLTTEKIGWFGKKNKTEYSYSDIYFLGDVVQNTVTSIINGIQLTVVNKETDKTETWHFITNVKLYNRQPSYFYVNTKKGKQNFKSLVAENLAWWENSNFSLFIVNEGKI